MIPNNISLIKIFYCYLPIFTCRTYYYATLSFEKSIGIFHVNKFNATRRELAEADVL